MKKLLLSCIFSLAIIASSFAQIERNVVCFEGTFTTCGWCPRGMAIMEYMVAEEPDYLIPIVVHDFPSDPMKPEGIDTFSGHSMIAFATGFPSFWVDGYRHVQAGPSLDEGISNLQEVYTEQRNDAPPVAVTVNPQWNNETREIIMNITADFVADLSGDLRFNAIVVENDVTGITMDYDQTNNYGGGAFGECGGYELLPNPIPAADMVYEYVARKFMADWFGEENSLPETITAGESYEYSFNYTLPLNYDKYKMMIVGIVSRGSGEILNAGYQMVDPTLIGHSINFSVVDGASPLEGAIITIDGVEMTTDANGETTFTQMEDGNYNYSVSQNGYDAYDDVVEVAGGDVDVEINLVIDGIGNISNRSLEIHPNPVTNTVNISFNEVIEKINICSIEGKEIETHHISSQNCHLDVSHLEKGMYLLKINTSKGSITQKMIKK